MWWKHLVSEEKSYSSVQSNFFKWYLLQPFNSPLPLSGSPLFLYHRTTSVLTWEDRVNFCLHFSIRHFARLQCSFCVPHEYFKGIYTIYIKGPSSCQNFRPVARLPLSKAGSYGESWTQWTGGGLQAHTQSNGKEWKEMLQSTTHTKNQWQIRADVKNRQLCLSLPQRNGSLELLNLRNLHHLPKCRCPVSQVPRKDTASSNNLGAYEASTLGTLKREENKLSMHARVCNSTEFTDFIAVVIFLAFFPSRGFCFLLFHPFTTEPSSGWDIIC